MHRPKGRFCQSNYMDTIKDFWGDNWIVSEVRPPNTKHPAVYFGRKQGIRGGQRVIITRELAAYIATRTYTECASSLPIGANTLKRILHDMDSGGYPYPLINISGQPYNPPKVKRGDVIHDEVSGNVVVGGAALFGTLVWIYRKDTGTPILCGELADAVKTKSAAYTGGLLGLSQATIAKWRGALGVTRSNNAGTLQLYRDLKPLKLTDERTKKGRESPKNNGLAKMIQRRKAHALNWDSVDWTQSNQQIAAKLGAKLRTVVSKRCRLKKAKEIKND